MANNNILLILLVVAVVLFLYYFVFDQKLGSACKLCPQCNQKTTDGKCPDCPSCLLTREDAMQALKQMAKGCTHRLRGVVREDMISASDVSEFMTGGVNRLTILTNVDPEDFIAMIQSGHQPALDQLKAVAMSSSMVNNKKSYLVMTMSDGRMNPIGSPTTQFADAVKNLESTARKQLGADVNNLVFFIDEDIPCPQEVTPV